MAITSGASPTRSSRSNVVIGVSGSWRANESFSDSTLNRTDRSCTTATAPSWYALTANTNMQPPRAHRLATSRRIFGMDPVDNLVVLSSRVVPTKVAVEIGPSPWRGLLEHHIEVARLELARFGGREVDATAYGFLASFDDPAAAIRCADAIRRDVRGLGIEVGAGIHIGECNVRGEIGRASCRERV